MKMNSELDNIRSFFTERRYKCLKISAIEKEAGIPAKSLDHFLTGRRSFNHENIDKLIPVLVDFGFKPIDEQFI